MIQNVNAALQVRPDEKIDPNKKQQAASDPAQSVWVGASAGTGKTKVLTDRVLRLLLPRDDGQVGTPAHRILCLTFTKAAASEMALRINQTLALWAVVEFDNPAEPQKGLRGRLESLLGQAPNEAQMEAAQRLFADVMETAGGLQIMTIHSFCQSVLGRFPLEAAIAPNFTPLEEKESSALLQSALAQILEKAQSPEQKNSPLARALHHVGGDIDERAFLSLIREISSERHQMSLLFRENSIEQIYASLCAFYDVPQNISENDVLTAFCADGTFDHGGLERTAEAMIDEGGKTSLSFGPVIMAWIKARPQQRVELLDGYRKVFITTKAEPRTQHFPVKDVKVAFPESVEILRRETLRLLDLHDTLNRMKSAALTRDILLIGHEILSVYENLKRLRGGLDFDDLILRTMDLLRGETPQLEGMGNASAWVMYKLDQGLDHILVDEAQDTNPEQWKIIEALCDEFFHGKGAKDHVRRTAFVVGDIKQSIYSFQRAAPEEFQRMQGVFDRKISDAGQENQNIDLDISFRSTRSVLRLVDHVFAEEALNKTVGGGVIHHQSYREGQGGCAEIWPLFENESKEKVDLWNPPLEIREQKSATAKMATHIAQIIAQWIERKEILKSAGRPVQAGDIMILVRSRTAFVDQLVRALKLKSIPVSGVDRMKLGEQLVVQDMLAVARFALLPEDDLNLACVLKSPFFGWTEEDVFALCHKRQGSVWSELQHFKDAKFKDKEDGPYPVLSEDKRLKSLKYLYNLIHMAQKSGAYEFFTSLLQHSCPADSVSGLRAIKGRLGEDAMDPMEELLNAALAFGRQNIDSLQLFVAEQDHKNTDIKRELEESGGKVRIMTVHGAKGLQAPIVILPDTIKTSRSKKISRLLWPAKTRLKHPLWSPRKEDDPQAYIAHFEECARRAAEEEGRLLYVAMTRASDRLYIAGCRPGTGSIDDSWYAKMHRAFEQDDTVQDIGAGGLRIENPQTAPHEQDKTTRKTRKIESSLPSWVFQDAPSEPALTKTLTPSKASGKEQGVMALSPLAGAKEFRFRRGVITHKLLQFLPEFESGLRQEAAYLFVEKNAADLSPEIQEGIVAEVIKILEHPEFAPFFSPGSMAEVAVSGMVTGNRMISGQIDRLVIGPQDIWILDYKTNRPPPSDPKDIPQVYRDQLQAYRDSIAVIYPQHKIHCALLWTDGPRFMRVE